MASYMLFLFLFSAINYCLLKKKKDSESKNGSPTTKLRVQAENPKNDLILKVDDFIYAKSAGNYLEVYYTSKEGIKKKLIRATIKKLVTQIETRKELMQCHQSFIVNLSKVNKVKGNSQNRYLVLNEELENVPVSRRFSKIILEAFNQKSQNLTEYP